ncbi:hypothetical protein CFC21_047225 [Triticum aestivum]|uniref:Sodium/calcium exchanger membrane region domain-containing protein n=2 Tax=Triticum aestivum TaxID=4565 RepID=A0A9R1FYC0_WHEAT|nr:hypothetical protein CFC21_047223 [Triticum aestivum]KAF7036634.1 hypothetical protein CFC21_047225 [Triticum aestivum]
MDSQSAVTMEAGAPTRKESGRLPSRHGGHAHGHSGLARTAHGMSSSSLRKKSDATLVRKVPVASLRPVLANLQEVLLGTKLAVLFIAVPLAVAAQCFRFGQVWVFALSLIGLIPLAERVSFLTEQIALYTGPTIGGLLNATCGNATELIIAVFALVQGKIEVVKCSLLGSVLSNLLLVLGTSLFCGGIKNLGADQPYDRLKTHRQLFEPQEIEGGDEEEEEAVLGFGSALFWLILMTIIIAVLSEYVVGTIEPTSQSWGLSVSFISIILLPIVGNAAEHAGAVIFALKNKLDITLGVALGSATQISMFVVPLSVLVAWIMGIQMDLDFKLLETGSLFISVLVTAFTLQDGTSHYLKGVLLLLCYIVIGACFFVTRQPAPHANNNGTLLDVPTGPMIVQVA